MDNKNKVYVTILFVVLFSLNTTLAVQVNGTDYMGESTNYQTMSDDNNSTENLEENSDDEIGVNAKIEKDLNFSKDGEIGANVEIVGNVVAEKNLTIGTNTIIQGNVIVKGDLELNPNVEITGYVKVNGNLIIGTNSKIDGTIYGYKKVNAGVNVETNGKLKSVGVFVSGTNYEGVGKIYTFGGRKMGVNAEFKDNKEKGVLGRLDAYLKIDITDEEFSEVKKMSNEYDIAFGENLTFLKKVKTSLIVDNSKLKVVKNDTDKEFLSAEIASLNEKLSITKNQGKDLVEQLISGVEIYIENEEFDKKGVSVFIKNEELAKLDMSSSISNNVSVGNNQVSVNDGNTSVNNNGGQNQNTTMINSSDKNEKIKTAMRGLLEQKLAKFDDEKKAKMYDILVIKLNTLIEKSNNPKMKNTLILLKEVIQEMQDESSVGSEIDNLLNGANNETITTETNNSTGSITTNN